MIGLDDKIAGHGHARQLSENHFLGSGLNTDIPSKTTKNRGLYFQHTFPLLYYNTVCEKVKTLYVHFDSEILLVLYIMYTIPLVVYFP